MDSGRRQLHLKLPDDVFRKLKVKCAYTGTSMQDYVVRLISQSMGEQSAVRGSLLIVEDETILRESFQDSLKDEHSVIAVGTGEEALELITARDFDIAIVDARLPGISGIEVIRQVKQVKPYITCIVITAYPSVELAVEAMKQGATDYLVKPVRLHELGQLVSNNLSKPGKEAPPLEQNVVNEKSAS